jgi:hypothetical protein
MPMYTWFPFVSFYDMTFFVSFIILNSSFSDAYIKLFQILPMQLAPNPRPNTLWHFFCTNFMCRVEHSRDFFFWNKKLIVA